MSVHMTFEMLMVFMFPNFATEVLGFNMLSSEACQYFAGLTRTILHRRQNSGNEDKFNDFLTLLMKARDDNGNALTLKQIADNGIGFFIAGTDTSAVTLANTFYLLALN